MCFSTVFSILEELSRSFLLRQYSSVKKVFIQPLMGHSILDLNNPRLILEKKTFDIWLRCCHVDHQISILHYFFFVFHKRGFKKALTNFKNIYALTLVRTKTCTQTKARKMSECMSVFVFVSVSVCIVLSDGLA